MTTFTTKKAQIQQQREEMLAFLDQRQQETIFNVTPENMEEYYSAFDFSEEEIFNEEDYQDYVNVISAQVAQTAPVLVKDERINKAYRNNMKDILVVRYEAIEGSQETGIASLVNSRKGVRVITKDMVIAHNDELEAAFNACNVHPASRKAFMTRLANETSGMVNMAEVASFTKSEGLKNFANQYVVFFHRTKFEQYLVRQVEFNVTDTNQTFMKSRIVLNSQSSLLENIADGEYVWAKYQSGSYEISSDAKNGYRPIKSALNIIVVETGLDEGDFNPVEKALRQGFTFEGERYTYLLRSASQRRTGKAYFIRQDSETTAAEARRKAGISVTDILENDGETFKFKSETRFGQSASNSSDLSYLNAALDGQLTYSKDEVTGYETITVNKKGEEDIKVLFVPDMVAEIEHGEAEVLDITNTREFINSDSSSGAVPTDSKAKSFVKAQAKDLGLQITISDGSGVIDYELMTLVNKNLGYNASAVQVRENTTFSKGMLYAYSVKEETGYDMILPESVVKGSLVKFIKGEGKFDFRSVGAPKEIGKQRDKTKLPTQFINNMGVSKELAFELSSEFIDGVTDVLHDPEKAIEYLRLEHAESLKDNAISAEHEESVIEKAAPTKVAELLQANPDAINDVYFKSNMFNVIEESMKDFFMGRFMTDGSYKFMAHDPILFVGIIKHNLENPSNLIGHNESNSVTEAEIIAAGIPYISAGEVVLKSEDGKYFSKRKVVLGRNPMIHPSEVIATRSVQSEGYAEELEKYESFMDNTVIFSVFDFIAFSMGGGDFDGDQAFAMLDPRVWNDVVKFQKENDITTVLDFSVVLENGEAVEVIEGCPFTSTISQAEFPEGLEFVQVSTTEEGQPLPELKVNAEELTLEEEQIIIDYLATVEADNMVDNNIGLITNRSITLMEGIYNANALLASGDAEKLLGEGAEKFIKEEIEKMFLYVSILRLAQGWDIDKAKHGGAFENYLFLDFMKTPPFFASALALNEEGKLIQLKERGLNGVLHVIWNKPRSVYGESYVSSPIDKYPSLMFASIEHNVNAWNNVVVTEENLNKFNPKYANLVEEVTTLPADRSVLTAGFIKQVSGVIANYNRGLALIAEKAEHLRQELLEVGEDLSKVDKYFSEQYEELVSSASEEFAHVINANGGVGRADIAAAKVAYLKVYNNKRLFQNQQQMAIALDESVSAKEVLSKAKSGLSFVYSVAFEEVREMFSILGNDEKLAVYEDQVELSSRYAKSDYEGSVILDLEAVELVKNHFVSKGFAGSEESLHKEAAEYVLSSLRNEIVKNNGMIEYKKGLRQLLNGDSYEAFKLVVNGVELASLSEESGASIFFALKEEGGFINIDGFENLSSSGRSAKFVSLAQA